MKRSAAVTMATALLAARLMTPLPAANAETAEQTFENGPAGSVLVADLDSDEITDESTDGVTDGITDELTDEFTDDTTDEFTNEDSDENTDGISDYSMFDFSDEFSDEFTDEFTDENSDERFVLRARGENMTLLRVGKQVYFVNDERSRLDAAPMVENGRTLLPLRFVAQAMGGDVSWDPAEQKVTIINGNDEIELWIGSNVARVNGALELIDPENDSVIAKVVPGANRTMVPVRFVAEALGADVFWDQDTRTISIKY